MSEIVVYTALAVVYRVSPHAATTPQRNSAPQPGVARKTVAVSSACANVGNDTATVPERAHSCSAINGRRAQWQPIANGAWAQIHVFLELDRATDRHSNTASSPTSSTSSSSVAKAFRLVAWVLDTGKVVVNDALVRGCKWDAVDDDAFREFTASDGRVYGFGFRTPAQAAECSHVVQQILSNVKAITRLVRKYFVTRSSASDVFAAPLDMQLLGLDRVQAGRIQQSMEDAATNYRRRMAVTTVCDRASSRVVYPKAELASVDTSNSNRGSVSDKIESDCSSSDSNDVDSSIVSASFVKRNSEHHILAQFTEVEIKTLQQTAGAQQLGPQQQLRWSDADTASVATDALDSQLVGALQSLARPFDATRSRTSERDAATVDAPSASDCDCESMRRWQTHAKTSSHIDVADSQRTAYESTAAAMSSVDRISFPFKTRQELHITYNAAHARYEGLPPAWRALNQQFGLPLEAVPKRTVDGYVAKIPAVLEMMRACLLAQGGTAVEGVFRVAPDKEECSTVKDAINSGTFNGCADVHIMANLIKVWFREVPQSLYNIVPVQHIYAVCKIENPYTVIAMLDDYPVAYRSVLLWLLDLMVDVVRDQAKNKMSARNMAIVMSPNLFSIATDNPMYALTMSQKVADYTFALLSARLALTVETSNNNSSSS